MFVIPSYYPNVSAGTCSTYWQVFVSYFYSGDPKDAELSKKWNSLFADVGNGIYTT